MSTNSSISLPFGYNQSNYSGFAKGCQLLSNKLNPINSISFLTCTFRANCL